MLSPTLRSGTLAALLFSCVTSLAYAGTMDVVCGTTTVGTITVNTNPGGSGGGGISGGFTSTVGGPPPTLAAAAAACGEASFNWYQIVTATNGAYVDRQGNALTPPFVDPPLNGLAANIDPTWADSMPWYYDQYAPAPGTPDYDASYQISNNTTADTLHFEDFPNGPAGPPARTVSFRTWLVSLNSDSSFHAFEGGFSWDWTKGTGVTNLTMDIANPTAAQYTNIIAGFSTNIPEPGTMALGAAALALLWRKRCAVR